MVHQVFLWRVSERLSYHAIADRLNLDLDRYPPKTSLRTELQRGSWSASSVRELSENPKYTGYMIWNRRASKTGNGRQNPPREWVWSPRPTHEPLVTVDLFKAARGFGEERKGSRNGADLNVNRSWRPSRLCATRTPSTCWTRWATPTRTPCGLP